MRTTRAKPINVPDPMPAGSVPPKQPQGFVAELFDAITPRTALLVLGVLLVQLAFVLSYVGAFHHPTPHRALVAVVAPAQISGHVVTQLNGLHGQPLFATAVPSEAAGLTLLRDGSTSGVFVVNPAGKTDSLFVASGGGAALATAVEDVFAHVEAAVHRTMTVTDAVPSQSGDARGLSGFYLVIGWLVGGYLVAALLGIAKGARPATTRRAIHRLIVLVPYAILSGLGGAMIVGPVLGALTGHFMALWWLGALLVFCAAAVTMAFQVFLGVFGIGLTLIVFVVLGNPSAGGAYQASLLPPFWRAIGSSIPNGAGVEAIRRIVYFGSYDVIGNLLVIAIYAIAGMALAITGASILARRAAAGKPDDAEVV
ncbi:MAG: DUF3533 domain-containing protein [Actinomycetota bacterium]|nr:DUF3533 domain-containing protein [Actinomycetota bacterium]